MNETAETLMFWDAVGKLIIVDKYHFRNHKEEHTYCRDHCDPNKCDDLKGVNTQICEQSFRWLSRFKYSMNHMTPARFAFFLVVMAEKRNYMLTVKRRKSNSMEVDM